MGYVTRATRCRLGSSNYRLAVAHQLGDLHTDHTDYLPSLVSFVFSGRQAAARQPLTTASMLLRIYCLGLDPTALVPCSLLTDAPQSTSLWLRSDTVMQNVISVHTALLISTG